MKYNYVASKEDGKIKKGEKEAGSANELRQQLLKDGLTPIEIIPASPIIAIFHRIKTLLGTQIFQKVSLLEKTLFTKHLAIMLLAGLNIEEALSITSGQAKGSLKRVIKEIQVMVQGGASLSAAVAQFPKVFTTMYANIVKVGESSGNLPNNLQHLSEQMFKDVKLRKNIQGAMIYPGIIFSMIILLGLGITLFVLPRVTNLFTSIDIDLPLITKILIATARFSSDNGVYIIIGLVALIILFRVLWKVNPVRLGLEFVILYLPITKNLIKNINLARFTRSLSSLISAGVPIDTALKTVTNATPNLVYQRGLRKIQAQVEKGQEIADVMAKNEGLFPKITHRLVKVGESTGELENVLNQLAEFYENEVDLATKNLTIVLEPVLLIITALVVGGLGLAIILPIYTFVTSVGSV